MPPAAAAPGPVATGPDRRRGLLSGTVAYTMWGVFPLVFHQLRDVPALQVLVHRVIWSFVLVVVVLAVTGDRSWHRVVLADRGTALRLAAAATALSVNWLVYIWAVGAGHVVEAAMGYYINPLLTVALGVVVRGERLRRAQWWALGFGAAAVGVLTVAYGRVPWISLCLAASFATYGFLKSSVSVPASTSLAAETAFLVPFALAGAATLALRGDLAFADGSWGRDLLLIALGAITAAPLVLFAVAAANLPLATLGLLQYLTPTMQLVCGVVVLGEAVPAQRAAGIALVWVALAILTVDLLRVLRTAPGPTGPPAPTLR